MPPNKDPDRETLSQAIDAEIDQKITARLGELQERLDERVQEKIQRDRAFIKDTIGVAFKVAGLAVAFVVVVLGALGWKTFGDVYKAMTDAAAGKAKEYFDTPQGRRIIDSTLDRSVLNSYLVRMALLNADKSQRQQLAIEDYDADRLLRIVNSTETDESTFESAANVLIVAFGDQKPAGAHESMMIGELGETFAVFITAKNKDAKWLQNNHTKRLWLLKKLNETRFADDQVKSACRDLLSTSAPVDLRLAAITYLGTIDDRDALDKLAELAVTGKDLVDAALIALAKIEPKSDVLTKWIADLDKTSDPSTETIATALKISEAWKDRKISDTRLKLVEFAARHCQLFFDGSRARFNKRLDYILIRLRDRDTSKFRTITPTIFLGQKDDWVDTITELLRRYAKQTDLSDFRRFVGWLTIKDYLEARSKLPVALVLSVRTKVMMSGSSLIKLEDGTVVDKRSAPDGVILDRVVEEIKKGEALERLQVSWTDPEKGESGGTLAAFENAQ